MNYSVPDLILKWDAIIAINKEHHILESAFLQIYVAFEKDLNETFVLFSLGNSHTAYTPVRKLVFTAKDQLFEVIKGEGTFVDYSKAIDRCSKHIFVKNVFGQITSMTNYSSCLSQMKIVRNYLAHGSQESKEKYMKSVLNMPNNTRFMEPGEFLLTKTTKANKTVYSQYIDCIEEIYNLLRNDAFLNSVS